MNNSLSNNFIFSAKGVVQKGDNWEENKLDLKTTLDFIYENKLTYQQIEERMFNEEVSLSLSIII